MTLKIGLCCSVDQSIRIEMGGKRAPAKHFEHAVKMLDYYD